MTVICRSRHNTWRRPNATLPGRHNNIWWVSCNCHFSWQPQFGEVQLSLFVAGAIFDEVQLSLFVVGSIFGDVGLPIRGRRGIW